MKRILCWLFGCKVVDTFQHEHEYGYISQIVFPPVTLGYCCLCGSGPWRLS